MFSALHLGSILYILEKGETPILRKGLIISISQPSLLINNSTIDISVKVGNTTMDFKNIPSSLSVVNYNNVLITETKELMSNEVETLLQNSKNIIDSMSYHNNVINTCELLLKDLNPRFAKEKERDEDICNLKDKIGGIESKMDKILTLLVKEDLK